MKKKFISLVSLVVLTLVVGTMGAMATNYSTPKSTPRTVTADDGATSYRQAGYDTGSILPYDDAYCWAKGSGSSGFTRDMYAKTGSGQASTYTTACTGYSSKQEIQSVSSGNDTDTGECYTTINSVKDKLTVTN
jgi:hypothetical protein